MSQNPAWEIAGLEQELAELRKQLESADSVSAERRRGHQSRAQFDDGVEDVLPLRDRISVLEHKVARLKNRKW